MTSIRRRLLAWLLTALIAVGAAAAVAIYLRTSEDVNTLFDYQLQQLAYQLRNRNFLHQGGPDSGTDDSGADFITEIWDGSGVLIYYSQPDYELPLPRTLGFSNVKWNSREWRVFTTVYRNHTIQVAHPFSLRHQMTAQMAQRALLPMAVLIPLLGVLIWFAVGRNLRPLERVSAQLRARSPAALEPLSTARLPREVTPLVTALNHLLDRLGVTLRKQRQFVADAAHELRTPLAAVQLQIQLVERAASAQERNAALERLKQGVARSARLVQQLLTLARLEPDAATPAHAPVDLRALATEVVAELTPIAQEKNVDLGISELHDATTLGDATALQTLLGNLVDNAVRYTPAGGRVDVALRTVDRKVVITVEDTGPGIPPEDRERVFDRFYRRLGNDLPGSGLGLAIAREIVARHGGTITLADGPGGHGLTVVIGLHAIPK
ncbi:MAG TPA: ATP-binding protein [Burkholderiales bacterium]|jgi:two-component system OmpR family sensor kinase|nr:ATP-binding protein [Burkholderiales bacterium]